MQQLFEAQVTIRAGAQAVSRRFAAKADVCRHILSSGVPLKLRVNGTSMLPTLWPGESITVVPVRIADLQRGDVVVFAACDHFVVHRIVGQVADAAGIALITRGDAQLHSDAPIHPTKLLGAVAAVHRFGAARPVRRRLHAAAGGVARFARRSVRFRSFLGRVALVARASTAPGTGNA